MSGEDSIEHVRTISETCEKLVDDAVQGKISVEEFGIELKKTGITTVAAEDYIQEFRQRFTLQHSIRHPIPSNTATAGSQEQDSDEGNRNQNSNSPENQVPPNPLTSAEADNEVAWALLTAKLRQIRSDCSSTGAQAEESISELLRVLAPSHSTSLAIPSSVLIVAPHLAKLSKHPDLDEHLQSTQRLHQAFSTEKAVEPIIDLMQTQHLSDPIPRSIWRKIIQDDYVDFERLYGSTDRHYSHQDDQKDFAGGFVLTKKEQISAKKPVKTEAEWIRMYAAWKTAVLLLYPHCQGELDKYQLTVMSLFRAVPNNPSSAIQFDIEARDRYARSPYRLDDKEELQLPLLTQLYRGANSGSKHDSDSPASGFSKRATVPCQNWSLGICNDPCPNRRKHGICSECGGQHRAKEIDGCRKKLQERKGTGSSHAASGGSGGRA
jgi:hypothetical protein